MHVIACFMQYYEWIGRIQHTIRKIDEEDVPPSDNHSFKYSSTCSLCYMHKQMNLIDCRKEVVLGWS
jgi:hypothetical protein